MIIYPPNILEKDTGKPAQPSPAQPMSVLLQHTGGSPGPQQHPARFHPPMLWPGTRPGISALPAAKAYGFGSDNRKRFFLKTTAAARAPPPAPPGCTQAQPSPLPLLVPPRPPNAVRGAPARGSAPRAPSSRTHRPSPWRHGPAQPGWARLGPMAEPGSRRYSGEGTR